MLIAMTGAGGGFAGYLRKVQAGAKGAETCSSSTIRRANDKYLHEKNLRAVLIELIAHKACPLCKDGNHKINVAHRRTVEKKQALEDAIADIASQARWTKRRVSVWPFSLRLLPQNLPLASELAFSLLDLRNSILKLLSES